MVNRDPRLADIEHLPANMVAVRGLHLELDQIGALEAKPRKDQAKDRGEMDLKREHRLDAGFQDRHLQNSCKWLRKRTFAAIIPVFNYWPSRFPVA